MIGGIAVDELRLLRLSRHNQARFLDANGEWKQLVSRGSRFAKRRWPGTPLDLRDGAL